jgi:hypothetical protein
MRSDTIAPVRLTWAILILCIVAADCRACVCIFKAAKESWEGTPIIFIGRVDRIEITTHAGRKRDFTHDSSPPYDTQRAWLRVDEPLKGTKIGDVFVTAEDGDCSWRFKDTKGQWLFYALPHGASNTVSLGCTRSRRLEDAGDDLLFLRSLPDSEKRNRLSGTVSLVRNIGRGMVDEVQKLSGIHLTVSGDAETREAVTDANGVFELTNLKSGTYRVQVVLPSADSIYRSYVIGQSVPLFSNSQMLEQPKPILMDTLTGVEVNFDLVPTDILQQAKSGRKRGNH